MNLRTLAALGVVAVFIAGGLWDLQSSIAQVASTPPLQDEPPQPQNAPQPIFGSEASTTGRSAYGGGGVYGGRGGGTLRTHLVAGKRPAPQALHEAAAALRDAKDDAARADAQAKLTELLQKYFDDDLRRREDELAKIEERTRQLRELLEKRRTKKSEILDLQVKVLLNEADGLGFFNEAPSYGPSAMSIGSPQGVRAWTTYPEAGAAYAPAQPSESAPWPKPAPSTR